MSPIQYEFQCKDSNFPPSSAPPSYSAENEPFQSTAANSSTTMTATSAHTQNLSLPTKSRSFFSSLNEQFIDLPAEKKLRFLYTIFCLFPVFLIYPVALVYVGIEHANSCTIKPLIPFWLISYGLVGILTVVILFILAEYVILSKPENKSKNIIDLLLFCLTIVVFFGLIWFFVGTVWLFRIHSQVDYVDKTSSSYCQPALFKFGFATLILQCILFGLFLICAPFTKYCCDWKKLNDILWK